MCTNQKTEIETCFMPVILTKLLCFWSIFRMMYYMTLTLPPSTEARFHLFWTCFGGLCILSPLFCHLLSLKTHSLDSLGEQL